MRILFIKPNMGLVDGRPYEDRGRMEPLTFAILAGLTPPGHELGLCDDRFEPVPYDQPWDLVAINTEIYTARRAYEIAGRFRAAGVPVIVGGYHTTMLPEEGLRYADAVALGDAETIWPDIVRDAAAKHLQPRYQGSCCPENPLRGIRTDWGIFRGKKYLPVALTQLSRGCSNSCEYCATGNIYRGRFAHRPVAEVVEELLRDGRKLVFFVDDNIIAAKEAARELFRALIPLKLHWTAQASLDVSSDPDLLDLMVKSGCAGLVIGFESLNRDNLAAMKKNVNLGFTSYATPVARLKEAGLMIWAAFLMGYDSDTPASIRETVDWILEQKFCFAAFNLLMPYPSTPFYARMAAADRLLYDGRWWLHDDYRFGYAAFKPRLMSPETLSEECLAARLKHNTVFQILRRASDRQTNSKDLWSLLTHFAYNPLFRDEMLKKHGMCLGYRGLERPTTPLPSWVRLRDGLRWNALVTKSLEVSRQGLGAVSGWLGGHR